MIRKILLMASLLLGAQGIAQAASVSISVGEVNQYVNNALASGDPVSMMIGNEIKARLDMAGIQFSESGLVFAGSVPQQNLRGGCSVRVNGSATFSATVNPESQLELIFNALNEPIVASVDFFGRLDATGYADMHFGAMILGHCFRYAEDSFSVNIGADLNLNFNLIVKLNPEKTVDPFTGDLTIRINPELFLTGEVRSLTNSTFEFKGLDSIEFVGLLLGGPIGAVLFNRLESRLERLVVNQFLTTGVANSEFQKILLEEQTKLRFKMAEALLDPLEFATWVEGDPVILDYQLPGIDNETYRLIISVIERLPKAFPITLEYLNDHKIEILFYAFIGDDQALLDLLGTSLACQASEVLLTSLPQKPVPPGIDYVDSSYTAFCDEIINANRLGNADIWDGSTTLIDKLPWTQAYGTQLNISVVSIRDNYQPYVQKVKYKTIEGVADGIGVCKLEMRVYKNNLGTNAGLKPMLAIHGGSWKYRGGAFYGLEAQISHFTQRGFVVFVPFYRLGEEVEANTECNGVTGEQIITDIDDAMAWVEANKAGYGAEGKITIMGQSAGALHSAWLATYNAPQVERVLLMYPPTDLENYLESVRSGAITDPRGAGALQAFFGVDDIALIDINSSIVAKGSLPPIIEVDPVPYPPMYMIHGFADTLVPSEQSVRLCNALSGSILNGPAANDPGNPFAGIYKKSYQCDDKGSRLDLLAEAQHGLEICVPGLKCQAGSDAALPSVEESLLNAYNWLGGNNSIQNWLAPAANYLLFKTNRQRN